MKLIIEIQMDNDAFQPDNGTEAARILRQVAKVIDRESKADGFYLRLHDSNGGGVGEARVTR
jgi:hypothetical protein